MAVFRDVVGGRSRKGKGRYGDYPESRNDARGGIGSCHCLWVKTTRKLVRDARTVPSSRGRGGI